MDNPEQRIQHAKQLFANGYNCAQAVVAAYADLYGLTQEQALLISASFGGGIGRMRLTCGAACGMFILAGLQTATTDPKNTAAKKHNYDVVQQLARQFQNQNGSLTCSQLLKLQTNQNTTHKQPCIKMVESAAKIFAQYLQENTQNQSPNTTTPQQKQK